MLSGEIARKYGAAGLPEDTIKFQFTGSAGQSFGAFLAKGVTLELEGDANDYVGKGLSGGRIDRVSAEDVHVCAGREHSGRQRGAVWRDQRRGVLQRRWPGERFAVRNSGATAVVEGLGDHGCEYMTNGLVIVLGKVGRNFAAGMSGGIAYVLDEIGQFGSFRCNKASVDLEAVVDAADHAAAAGAGLRGIWSYGESAGEVDSGELGYVAAEVCEGVSARI